MGEKREVEERRRREVSEWRERLETADEREKESKEELNRAEEKLAHLTLENSGTVSHYTCTCTCTHVRCTCNIDSVYTRHTCTHVIYMYQWSECCSG